MKTRLILTACASALLLGLPAAAFAEGAAPAVTTAAQASPAGPSGLPVDRHPAPAGTQSGADGREGDRAGRGTR